MQAYVDFILAIDRLKGVTRKIRPLGLERYENSAEHSWQLAVLASSLAHFAAEPVATERVVAMLLLHDLGEIETGDVLFYAQDGLAERKAAERAAVERLFALLPPEQGADFLALWEEFESGESAEARFAHAVDRAMPVLLNLANGGQSWREHGIAFAQVLDRVGPPIAAGCPALWDYLRERLESAASAGWFGMR